MDFKWLEDFISLIELKNFSAAAKARCVTQSAFSRRIRALEIWLGVPLFDRSSYPIALTEHGENFVPYVENLLNMVKMTKDDFYRASLKTDCTVRIVCLHSFSINLMPYLISQGTDYFEGLNFDLNPSVQGIDNHFQALLDESSDVLFAYNTKSMRPSLLLENKIEFQPLFMAEIIPVISPALLKTHTKSKPLPFLAYTDRTFLNNVVTEKTGTLGIKLETVFATTVSESLTRMAVEGNGMTWAPKHSIKKELKNNELVQFMPENQDLSIPLDVVCYRAKNNARPAVEQFWQGVHQLVNKDHLAEDWN